MTGGGLNFPIWKVNETKIRSEWQLIGGQTFQWTFLHCEIYLFLSVSTLECNDYATFTALCCAMSFALSQCLQQCSARGSKYLQRLLVCIGRTADWELFRDRGGMPVARSEAARPTFFCRRHWETPPPPITHENPPTPSRGGHCPSNICIVWTIFLSPDNFWHFAFDIWYWHNPKPSENV